MCLENGFQKKNKTVIHFSEGINHILYRALYIMGGIVV